jgi:hypothetical protein
MSPARLATLAALPIALLTGVLAFWLLGGFGAGRPEPAPRPAPRATGPVDVPAQSLDPQTAAVCRAVVAHLPPAVGDLPRRPVTAGAGQSAAYGDPPITLSCGGAPAPSLAPTATVFPLSGACWTVQEQPDATVWTSLYRAVPVRVRVPNAYPQPGQKVIAFSGAVRAGDPGLPDRPGDC